MVTLVPGVALIACAAWLHIAHHPDRLLLWILLGCGLLILYSTIYSLLADQWLLVDGERHTLRSHQKSRLGVPGWERPGGDFKELRVFRYFDVGNRTIILVVHKGIELSIRGNAFGLFARERALTLAKMTGELAAIPVVEI